MLLNAEFQLPSRFLISLIVPLLIMSGKLIKYFCIVIIEYSFQHHQISCVGSDRYSQSGLGTFSAQSMNVEVPAAKLLSRNLMILYCSLYRET